MRLGRLLVGAAVSLGTVAAANRGLRRGELPPPPLSGNHREFRWRGMDVAYTEAGDPDDPDLVLLHGINAAGSSGEWRAVFSDLAADHHVVAPDLPGFGRSDRPPLRYSAALYEDFVREFLDRFDEPTVVASGLTAAYAAAADGPVERFLLVCPVATAGPDPARGWLRELVRAPVVGEAAFNLLTSRPAIRYFNADHGYYDTAGLEDDWVDYEHATTHAPNARFAPAGFIAGDLNSEIDLGAALAQRDAPTTIVWGREAEITPLSLGRELAATADARLVVFDRAKLLPHVEYPDRFVETLRDAPTAAAD
jgi:pimeloyl-ACP methyl ester carboxylesterase